ncbi:MAG: hypothetical protein LBK55_08615 [Azoarcus sp.]|jgi:Fe2+ or Zn2+ uptake regulation protein|nr:hypothetical protein [Azoarcus sp.]
MPPYSRFRHDAPAHALIAGHGGRATHIQVALIDALFASEQPLTHDEIAAAPPEGYRLDRAELALHGACAACRTEAPAHP